MKKNNNIKRTLAAMAAVMMIATVATGCSSSSSSGGSYDAVQTTCPPSYENESSTNGMMGAAANSNTQSANASAASSERKNNAPSAVAPSADMAVEDVMPGDYYTPVAIEEPPMGGEEYNYVEETGFFDALNNPLSTFSADVDTASYSNIRRMLNDYGYVDPDAVRIEEMINYFDYEYVKPKNDLFSINVEMSDCPWNDEAKLMLVGMQAKEIKNTEDIDSNIVFLIDVSGSMFSDDKLPLVIDSFSMLTDNLSKNDRISIVTYAGSDEVVLSGVPGSDGKKIKKALNSLEAGGSTAGAAGINTAYELAEAYFIEGGNNRVILATDGDLNVGLSSEIELTDLIEEKRESGVFLSVLGFGTGNIKDNRLEALADHGNGNYSYIDSIKEANKVLVREMDSTLYTVAKDVKFQVEFNPAYVSQYRLVGYDNRIMAAEDFNDDTKDAGEIGSGHCVTALYEIVTVDEGSDITLKYQPEKNKPEVNMNGEWLTVSVRCKQPDGDKSELYQFPVTNKAYTEKMPENLRFASAVAEFGMLLKDSAYKGSATYDGLQKQLKGCALTDEYRKEFAGLVEEAARRMG